MRVHIWAHLAHGQQGRSVTFGPHFEGGAIPCVVSSILSSYSTLLVVCRQSVGGRQENMVRSVLSVRWRLGLDHPLIYRGTVRLFGSTPFTLARAPGPDEAASQPGRIES